MHPCPGNWVAIRSVVVYYAQGAHAFSARIKCHHCMLTETHDEEPYARLITVKNGAGMTIVHVQRSL